jgi:hypothetical protein
MPAPKAARDVKPILLARGKCSVPTPAPEVVDGDVETDNAEISHVGQASEPQALDENTESTTVFPPPEPGAVDEEMGNTEKDVDRPPDATVDEEMGDQMAEDAWGSWGPDGEEIEGTNVDPPELNATEPGPDAADESMDQPGPDAADEDVDDHWSEKGEKPEISNDVGDTIAEATDLDTIAEATDPNDVNIDIAEFTAVQRSVVRSKSGPPKHPPKGGAVARPKFKGR